MLLGASPSVVSCQLSVVSSQLSFLTVPLDLTKEDKMARTNFERLRVYQLSEKLADQVWEVVLGWNNFARDTVVKQIVRSADSIRANVSKRYDPGCSLP